MTAWHAVAAATLGLVAELHAPVTICEDEMLCGGQDLTHYHATVCRHCCCDQFGDQTEDCLDHDHGPGDPICATAAILDRYEAAILDRFAMTAFIRCDLCQAESEGGLYPREWTHQHSSHGGRGQLLRDPERDRQCQQ